MLVVVSTLLPASALLVYASAGHWASLLAAFVGGYSATGSLAGGGVGGAAQPIQSAVLADIQPRGTDGLVRPSFVSHRDRGGRRRSRCARGLAAWPSRTGRAAPRDDSRCLGAAGRVLRACQGGPSTADDAATETRRPIGARCSTRS